VTARVEHRPLSFQRIPSLDGLRALSIALVCAAHFAYSYRFPLPYHPILDKYAHYGVRIFFVISGFLITTLLISERERTGTINIKLFFIRRAYRILPVAYVYLVVITGVFHKSLTHRDLAIAYGYASAYFETRLPWVLSHLWSLSVEEQFYLIWPLALAFSFTLARRFALLAIVLAPLCHVLLVALGLRQGAPYFFPSVADSLAAGCLLALFQPQLQRYRAFFVWRGFPFIWTLTLFIPFLHRYTPAALRYWGFPHLALASSVAFLSVFNLGMILCVQNAIVVPPRLLNTRVVAWIGTLSYSLYIWQMPFADPDARSWVTSFPQNLLFAFLAAVISYYLVEQPVLRIRARRARPRHTCVLPGAVAVASAPEVQVPSRDAQGTAA